jgi:hypothetical protein
MFIFLSWIVPKNLNGSNIKNGNLYFWLVISFILQNPGPVSPDSTEYATNVISFSGKARFS